MEFKEMSIDALEERKAQIKIEVESEDADLDALEDEVRSINAEIELRKAEATKNVETRQNVADGEGKEIKKLGENKMENLEVRNTKAYMDAYAEFLKNGNDKECRALLSENGSGVVPVPAMVEEGIRHAWDDNKLVSLCKKTYIKGNLKVGFERSSTGAEVHDEGDEANDEETLLLGIATLVPESLKKWITISDEALDLTGEAFLQYVLDEITYQIVKLAEDTIIDDIESSPSTSSATAPAVPVLTDAPAVDTIIQAIALTSDEARNLCVVMNKQTWASMISAAKTANYGVDPFDGLQVFFNNSLPAYTSATAGDVYAIVGDFNGYQFNFPNGQNVTLKIDDKSLAEADLVKVIGRMYAGHGVVAPKYFVNIKKPNA